MTLHRHPRLTSDPAHTSQMPEWTHPPQPHVPYWHRCPQRCRGVRLEVQAREDRTAAWNLKVLPSPRMDPSAESKSFPNSPSMSEESLAEHRTMLPRGWPLGKARLKSNNKKRNKRTSWTRDTSRCAIWERQPSQIDLRQVTKQTTTEITLEQTKVRISVARTHCLKCKIFNKKLGDMKRNKKARPILRVGNKQSIKTTSSTPNCWISTVKPSE